jgi:hypothetical protein
VQEDDFSVDGFVAKTVILKIPVLPVLNDCICSVLK